jgi:DNA-binding MarR family transcriptional regulator
VLIYGGPQTVTGLARREGVATPTMTRIVDALVRDALVERAAVPGDRRQVRLTATDAGRQLLERGRARRIERLAAEVGELKPKQQKALERALAILEDLETVQPRERPR